MLRLSHGLLKWVVSILQIGDLDVANFPVDFALWGLQNLQKQQIKIFTGDGNFGLWLLEMDGKSDPLAQASRTYQC